MLKKPVFSYFIIGAFACLLFIPFLGRVHLFDWDEINFAECAREMLVSKNYAQVTINFEPFWEKPPLFIWMQVVSMKIFGVNEFAARMPDAVCGILTLLLVFRIGSKLKNERLGFFWCLAYCGSILPQVYFKSGIIDPWFNLFICLGIYFLYLYTHEIKLKNLILSGVFIGLAVMTKGPVALLIYGICMVIYWVSNKFKRIASLPHLILLAVLILLIGGSWFLLQFVLGRSDLIMEFVQYQIRLFKTEDSGHGGPIYYHVLVLLLGCFPASIVFLPGFKSSTSENPQLIDFKRWMVILFMVVLVIFSVVKTKILHYSSLCYFPMTFLAAYAAEQLVTGGIKWHKGMSWLLGVIGALLGTAFIALPVVAWNKEQLIASNLIHDEFAVANLQAAVDWPWYTLVPGLFFIVGLIVILIAIRTNRIQFAITGIFLVAMITTNLITVVFLPRIEGYSQQAAIEFYKAHSAENCYIETMGFKSYAHLFYGGVQPRKKFIGVHGEWLMNESLDKPAYFVCKINEAQRKQVQFPLLKRLYSKNGFVFFKFD